MGEDSGEDRAGSPGAPHSRSAALQPPRLTVVAAPRALTVAAQSLQPPKRPHSRCTVAAGPHSRCAALQPPRCPLQSLQVPRPSQSLRSVAALSESEDCWERFAESNLIDLLGVNLHFRIFYTQNGV